MRDNLVFVKENGKVIRGYIYKPDTKEEKYPTVIFSHGFGSSCQFFLHHADDVIKAGFACIFFDFIGGGQVSLSDGTIEEMTIETEVEDLSEILEFTKKLSFVDEDKIFLWGESQGGVVSTLVGVKNINETAGLILWYPAFVIPDGARERLKAGINEAFGIKLCPDYDIIASKLNLYEEMDKYKNPVMIIHGNRDEVVDVEYSKKALGHFEKSSLVVIDGAGHGYDANQGIYARSLAINFIKFLCS